MQGKNENQIREMANNIAKERGIDLNIYPNLSGKAWHCSYIPNAVENMKNDKFKQITCGDNLVDAAFEMICWLKEDNKL